MWQLLVIDGADAKQRFPLAEQGVMSIGNNEKDATICLHDLYVARLHCRLTVQNSHVTVTDNHSPNGTFVNGTRVTEHELKLGDVLRIGNSHLRLEEVNPADIAPAQAQQQPEQNDGPKVLPNLPANRLAELKGHVLAHYKLIKVLGTGDNAVVFLGEDIKKDQVVALKVLAPQFAKDSSRLQRYVDAVKSVLPLRHDNLVTLLNAGKTGPYCWMALECIWGETLAQVLEQTVAGATIKWRPALRMAIHIGRALEYLHQRHLHHCNITPRHILIRDSDKVAKLGDLVLSRTLEPDAFQKAVVLDMDHWTDLAYRSPEQVMPGAFVDGLSDIYSLGAVVYARLTGRPPFVAHSPEELLEMIKGGMPTKPRKFQEAIPVEFEIAVMRMLAPRQEDRYQTARELLMDLEEIAEEAEIKV